MNCETDLTHYQMRHLFKVELGARRFRGPGSSSLTLTGTRKRFPRIRVTIPSVIRSWLSSCKRQQQTSVAGGQADEEMRKDFNDLDYRS